MDGTWHPITYSHRRVVTYMVTSYSQRYVVDDAIRISQLYQKKNTEKKINLLFLMMIHTYFPYFPKNMHKNDASIYDASFLLGAREEGTALW